MNMAKQDRSFADNGLMPCNIEMEDVLLKGLLFDRMAIHRIAGILKPEHFYLQAHQTIYGGILRLYRDERPIDLMTLTVELTETIGQERARDLVLNIAGDTVSALHVDVYAKEIVQKWKLRRAIADMQKAISAIQEGALNGDQVSSQAEHILSRLVEDSSGAETIRSLADCNASAFGAMEGVLEEKRVDILSSGYAVLDDIIQGGFHPGKLYVAAGRPGLGKSALAVNGFALAAARQQRRVALFSLEMDGEEVAQRIWASIVSDPQITKIINVPKLDSHDWDQLGYVVSQTSSLPLYIDDNPTVDVNHIRATCRRLKLQAGLDLVVIDYLQIMSLPINRQTNETTAIGQVTRELKNLSRELGVPIILLSQLSREVENRSNKRPMSSDLRSSGAIEQDADLIMMLYRDEVYHPGEGNEGDAELIITKNRGGRLGTVNLHFQGNKFCFI